MADDEQQFDDEHEVTTEEVESGKKFGFLPAVVFQILKWVLLVIGGIILVVTISVITFNLLVKGRQAESQVSSSPEYKSNTMVYAKFTNIETIRGATSDNPPRSYLASFYINYEEGKVNTQAELIAKTQDIQNLILLFLSSRTADELSPKYYIEIQEALTERINDMMSEKIQAIKLLELQVF